MRQECEAKLTLTSTNYETRITTLEKELAEAKEQVNQYSICVPLISKPFCLFTSFDFSSSWLLVEVLNPELFGKSLLSYQITSPVPGNFLETLYTQSANSQIGRFTSEAGFTHALKVLQSP